MLDFGRLDSWLDATEKDYIKILLYNKGLISECCQPGGKKRLLRLYGSRFKVKAMKEGLYSLDKYPVHAVF